LERRRGSGQVIPRAFGGEGRFERTAPGEAAATLYINLCTWPLDVPAGAEERLASLLSEDELTRAGRFVSALDRARFIVARTGLRQVLADLTDALPKDVRFTYSAKGRPALAGQEGDLDFSLSHSQGLAAVAVTRGVRVGLDIEGLRPVKENIAARYFSQAEHRELACLPAADQLAGFYRCWTRKEAVLKALGDGLSRPLDSFDVSVARDTPILERLDGDPGAMRHWTLFHLEPAPGFVGAIACRAGSQPVTLVALGPPRIVRPQLKREG
jgi:4'-phosphopantetheinyl transferase